MNSKIWLSSFARGLSSSINNIAFLFSTSIEERVCSDVNADKQPRKMVFLTKLRSTSCRIISSASLQSPSISYVRKVSFRSEVFKRCSSDLDAFDAPADSSFSEVSIDLSECSRSDERVDLILSILYPASILWVKAGYITLTNPLHFLYERTSVRFPGEVQQMIIFSCYPKEMFCPIFFSDK